MIFHQTVESFYILWRTTGDVRWRERGWAVFEAIERHARQTAGYASILNVSAPTEQVVPKDEMPSFFLAETYVSFDLYLVRDADAAVD